MSKPTFKVAITDLADPPLPDEGFHEAAVCAVRVRKSEQGNETIQVVFHLRDGDPECDRVTDYFVIEGASPQALAISRRRFVALLRACGLEPERDEEIELSDLVGAKLDIRIGHELYQSTLRARVLSYREQP
jgi:hypothetical protein